MTRLLAKLGAGIAVAMLAALGLVAWLLGDSLSLRMARRVALRMRGGVAVMCDLLDRAGPSEIETRRAYLESVVGMPVRLVDRTDPEVAPFASRVRPHVPYVVRRSGRYFIYAGLASKPKVLVLGPARWAHILGPGDLAAAGAVTLAVILLVALALAAGMARRVARIEQAASALASGRLEARIGAGEGGDAIDRLASHFDHMADRIQAMVETQKTVLERVSHDLRTPIARMRFQLELLRDGLSAPSPSVGETASPVEERISAMERDLEEMDGLVEEILLYARMRSGSRPLDLQPVPVRELAVNLLVHLPFLAGSELTTAVEGDALLRCDERYLRRALSNLLANAARHAEHRILVRIRELAEAVEIAVEDDGPGIPEADRARIFEPFVRLGSDGTAPSDQGLGLGLSVVRAAVEAHGGSVRAEVSELAGARIVTLWPKK